MKKFLLPAALMLTLFSCAPKQQKTALPVYLDDTKPVEARVEDALSRMTLEEKVAVLHAQSKFSSAGVPRLGIPEILVHRRPSRNQGRSLLGRMGPGRLDQ